ncbi:hypothetical protein GCM10007857_72950 [Bradyrhizobium iriomotense]|uniref:SAM domain-containing protein n=1 Tax=Bradyrhizobium iriomotense TaxID=441950 RepID=A0ABQ6BCB4_9BRAD|nr:hypothetical protein GCM10007857_72950 [Bradyrhizobium iriomotense]
MLFSLTAEDLKGLGVTLVRHRRKILDAIAALKADAQSHETTSKFVATADTRPAEAAERRQVTVLFSDLVGSTALSKGVDLLARSQMRMDASLTKANSWQRACHIGSRHDGTA